MPKKQPVLDLFSCFLFSFDFFISYLAIKKRIKQSSNPIREAEKRDSSSDGENIYAKKKRREEGINIYL